MASASGWMPIFLSPDVQKTGKIFPARTPRLRPALSSSWVSVPASKNFSISASSASATISMSASRAALACSATVSGTAPSVIFPDSSPANVYAFIPTRSTTPVNPCSTPMGICTGTQFRPSTERMDSRARSRLARSRSSRLSAMSRGSWNSSARPHVFSVETSTPPTASMTTSAASAARRAARASLKKLPMPGVSMRLILVLFHSTTATAAESVCLRAISSSS